MNATARSLGMSQTRYTDPSGYDDASACRLQWTRCALSIGP